MKELIPRYFRLIKSMGIKWPMYVLNVATLGGREFFRQIERLSWKAGETQVHSYLSEEYKDAYGWPLTKKEGE